ncbi:NAD-dependent epimerase/dehydratase family protein [Mesobacterium pallidum]|uniref:NAD-dependent epimerase/dehydratase family protein n=1 Tax=Mesobacterium pallidum TaxID=2872037 RepID=UPI001EE17234
MLGGSGKVGRRVMACWRGRDARSVITLGRSGAEVTWAPGDPVPDVRADAVVALWGVVPRPGRDLSQNAALARAAMDLGAALGADRVLHCSTGAVYAPGATGLTEDAVPDPRNPYGAAKVEMERAAAAIPAPASCCLRIGNVAGCDSLFASLERGGTVTLDRFADGRGPRRSYVAVSDLCALLDRLVACDLSELPALLNVGGAQAVGMDAIARAAGRDVAWTEAPAGAVPEVWLDTTRLEALAGTLGSSGDPAALVADWQAWRAA